MTVTGKSKAPKQFWQLSQVEPQEEAAASAKSSSVVCDVCGKKPEEPSLKRLMCYARIPHTHSLLQRTSTRARVANCNCEFFWEKQ